MACEGCLPADFLENRELNLNALISIHPHFVRQIIYGYKAVEIRRRKVSMPSGTRLWLYATRPEGCISAVAQVRETEVGPPVDIWQRVAKISGVTEEQFFEYCGCCSNVTAVFLEGVEQLNSVVSLSKVREVVPSFHPPQFFSWLSRHPDLLELLENTPRTARYRL
jgi:predicted transcriptional regulator